MSRLIAISIDNVKIRGKMYNVQNTQHTVGPEYITRVEWSEDGVWQSPEADKSRIKAR